MNEELHQGDIQGGSLTSGPLPVVIVINNINNPSLVFTNNLTIDDK